MVKTNIETDYFFFGKNDAGEDTGVKIEVLNCDDLRVERYEPREHKSRPVVIQPGLFSQHWTFLKFAEKIANFGYEVFVPTLRGHGDSLPKTDLGSLRIDDYAADLQDFIEYLGEPVTLIGHSAGVISAMKVALAKKEQVKEFIGMMAPPPPGHMMGWETTKRMTKYLPRMLVGDRIRISQRDSRAVLFNRLPEQEALCAHGNLHPESGWAALELATGVHDYKPLGIPTHIIRGIFDVHTPNQEAVANKMNAVMWEIPTCHMFMYDPRILDAVSTVYLILKASNNN